MTSYAHALLSPTVQNNIFPLFALYGQCVRVTAERTQPPRILLIGEYLLCRAIMGADAK
jgi:hypothetical protein